jgi:diaminopimelate decarboxylase
LKEFLTPLMKKTTPARRSSAPGAASRQAHTIELDAAAIATPFWIYDAAAIERQIEKLRAFDVIRYAQKANSNLSVPEVMRRNGVLVDAVLDGSWV